MMKRFILVLITFSLLFSAQTVSAVVGETGKGGGTLSDAEKEAVLSEIYEADIPFIKEVIALKLLTCEEVTSYYLQRIESYNETYNCFITICDDALEKARERDRQLASGEAEGALFGVPIVIKDNMDLAGYPTTNGREIASAPVAADHAVIVERLLEEGAVIIGKTNMSTDAQDARASYSEAVGETKNAYDPLLTTGGSSGGTAAAVSLNFSGAGLGTDTNSSLRIPAVLNGCVSLRASFGIIPTAGIVQLNGTRDVPGAITRSVLDQAVMMDVLTEGAYHFTENLDSDALEGLRLGVVSELTYPQEDSYERTEENVDREVLTAFEEATEEMERCGADIVEVSLPDVIAISDASLVDDSPYLRGRLYEQVAKLMEDQQVDALIFPTYLSAPLKSGVDDDGIVWDYWNQVFINNGPALSPPIGIPEISIPIGNHSSGAAIGMEIASLKGDEQLLLDIAYSYTEEFDHRETPAGAPDLYESSDAAFPVKAITDRIVVCSAVGQIVSAGQQPSEKLNLKGNILIFGIILAVLIILIVAFVKRDGKRRREQQPNPVIDREDGADQSDVAEQTSRMDESSERTVSVRRVMQRKRRYDRKNSGYRISNVEIKAARRKQDETGKARRRREWKK